ncbi:MAG: zinc ABC transporter substrate-binding protein [Patescibacteria group bacterium]|nr:zinc ABC transporter substrate-binding protein [Patescibacteria group bacterium]
MAMRFLGRLGLVVVVGFSVLGAVLVARYGPSSDMADSGARILAVTIPPQADLVERLAGDRFQVEIAVPPGQDPHVFSPSPRQVTRLSRAVAYFRIGMPLEDQLLPRLARQTTKVVDTTAEIRRRSFGDKEAGACDGHHHAHHGSGHTCDAHAGHPDPHVWLTPALLASQAESIAETLCELDPPGADFYRENLRTLKARLDEVDRELAAELAPYRGQAFYIFHPAMGYFADAYGLRQVAVELEGKSPSPRQLKTLIDQAKSDGVKIIFVQPQFDQRSAEAVAAAIGGSVEVIDPLRKDVVDNLIHIASQLQRGLAR